MKNFPEWVEALSKQLSIKPDDLNGLCICEKPDQMRKLQAAYANMIDKPCKLSFMAFAGHIMTMLEPAEYKAEWGKPWSKDVLPMIPETFKYKVSDGYENIFNRLKAELTTKKYNFVVNCCDADREGEAIFAIPVNYVGWKGPQLRLWNHDATDEGYQDALRKLLPYKPGSDLNNIRNASVYRAMLDWLIGMSGSRAVAMATNIRLPDKQAVAVGRVKTPVVAMVVARDNAIAGFKSAKFYQIRANFPGFTASWYSDDIATVDSKDKADDIVRLSGLNGKVTDKTVTRKKTLPPQLFSLSELQKAASRKYGMTAAKVLDTVQALYEEKLVSYPRTDARVLASDKAKDLPKMFDCIKDIPEISAAVRAVAADKQRIAAVTNDKRYFCDQKITAHHALVPTGQKANMSTLSGDKLKIYMMIVKQFVGIFMDAYEYDETVVNIEMENGQTYKATSAIPIVQGWKALGTDDDDKDKDEDGKDSAEPAQDLTKVKKGESLVAKSVEPVEKSTKAPSKYTDASLIADMTNCAKFATDPKVKAILKDKGGLGTEATRAALIEDCIKKKLLERNGKHIVSTEAARVLIAAMKGVDLVSPDMTAVWEEHLRSVEAGELTAKDFRARMEHYVQDTTKTLLALPPVAYDATAEVIGKCPKCGGSVTESPKAYACQSNSKEHPCFICWKEMLGAKVTKTDMKALLSGKKTAEKNFTSKAGKAFTARLFVNDEFVVSFAFDDAKTDGDTKPVKAAAKSAAASTAATPKAEEQAPADETVTSTPAPASDTIDYIGNCPKCGSRVKMVGQWVFCEKHSSKNPSSCPFYASTKMSGVELSRDEFVAMLKGKPSNEHEFISRKTNKPFKARVYLTADGPQYKF